MKTNLQAIQIVYDALSGSVLEDAITGELFKSDRPDGRAMEDVITNSLPISAGQIQEATVNVNIVVPNLSLQVNGSTDRSQPNLVRLEELTLFAIPLLTDQWGPDYNYTIEQITLFEEDDLNQCYQNIRVKFYSENL